MSVKKLGTQELHQYMATKRVLIAEPSVPFSSVIHQTMTAMGCKPENIWKEAEFLQALNLLGTTQPEIIISEYHLGKGFGLELAVKQAKYIQNPTDRIFILVTANASDSAVAEAAEEEIDGYILKPFNIKQLQDTFLTVMHKKMNPTPYISEIQKGKQHLQDKEYDSAREIFKQAKSFDKKPSLACYYEGHSSRELKELDSALKSFQEGRSYIPLHYKCLQGEFDILFEQQKKKEAYEVIKLINQNYPVSPGTLAKMFLLAIFTYNYKDIEKYYEIFITLDRRSDELVKIVGAALYSAGRFCLQAGDISLAEDFFRKGVAVAQREKSYLSRVVQALIKEKRFEEADKFLMMFNPEDRESAEFLQLDFEVVRRTRQPAEALDKGKSMIDEGKANPEVYREVVKILIAQNKTTAAEEVIFKSAKDFPELRAELYSLIESRKAS